MTERSPSLCALLERHLSLISFRDVIKQFHHLWHRAAISPPSVPPSSIITETGRPITGSILLDISSWLIDHPLPPCPYQHCVLFLSHSSVENAAANASPVHLLFLSPRPCILTSGPASYPRLARSYFAHPFPSVAGLGLFCLIVFRV